MRSLFLLVAVISAYGQEFDVASIRVSRSTDLNTSILATHGRMEAVNISLQTLIRVGYKVGTSQIAGGPSWLTSARFDIQAKTSRPVDRLSDMQPEIQALLADRFGLEVHTEQRNTRTVLLVPAKGGLTIRDSGAGDGKLSMTRHSLDGNNVSMDNVVKALSDVTGSIVVNQTGYAPLFDIHISWSPSAEEYRDDSLPSLYTVLKDQFGISVKSATLLVPVVVIDRALLPGQN